MQRVKLHTPQLVRVLLPRAVVKLRCCDVRVQLAVRLCERKMRCSGRARRSPHLLKAEGSLGATAPREGHPKGSAPAQSVRMCMSCCCTKWAASRCCCETRLMADRGVDVLLRR